jgi:hypothetical protein
MMNYLFFSVIHDTQYDEAMLLEQLEECSRAVEKAERYEMQLEIYRLLYQLMKNRETTLH